MEKSTESEGFQNFLEEHGADVLRFCIILTENRERGNDLYQDTVLTLLEKKKKFETNEKQKAYALSITNFLWKNAKKKYAVHRRLAPEESLEGMWEAAGEDMIPDSSPSPEEALLKAREAEKVREAVLALPEKYRYPVELYYSADASLQEIAEVLKIPLSTVKTRLRRAKLLLKDALEGEFDDR